MDFIVDYINPVAEIGQRPAEEIVDRRFLDVWPGVTGSPIWGMYLHLMETGEPIILDNFTYREVIGGQAVTAAFDIRATRLGDGFLQSFRDVTERYRLQQELAASEKRFRTAVDALMDPFFIFGPVRDGQGKTVDLEYRYINQAALQLYRMPLQDIIGHSVLELFPSNRENASWDTYLEPIQTGVAARADLPFFDDHGVTGRFEVSLTPFDGGLIVTARDVSEAKQVQEALQASEKRFRSALDAMMDPWSEARRTEEALRASEERFRTSVEALQDGFAVFSAIRDSAGTVTDFRYEYINEAACRTVQRSREDTLGHTLAELLPASVTSGLLAAYARVAETGEPLAREDVDYEDVHGGRRVARAFDIRVVKLGDGIVATWRDVADRRQAEETITGQAAELRRNAAELEDRIKQRTADLLRSNQELESFSYSVAHDLRTPLRAIDGYCQILLDEHAAQLDQDGQELLGTVGRSAVRMGHLIDGVLDLARIGREDIEYVRIDMTALAGSVVIDLQRSHAGGWPAITVGQLAEASGDPELIRQVWENLIGNAVKFTAGRADARVSVESETGAGEVVYHVRDNGIGFDMAYAGKLFGAFQQLRPAEFPGTGIGLAIVARIVERNGGRTWAEGRPGDGACFSFALPAPPAEESGTPYTLLHARSRSRRGDLAGQGLVTWPQAAGSRRASHC